MSNTMPYALIGGLIAAILASPAYAQAPRQAMDENMVMLPMDIPLGEEPVQAAPAPRKSFPQQPRHTLPANPYAVQQQNVPEDNMVMVPDAAEAQPVQASKSTYPKARPEDDDFVPITGPNYVEAGINFHDVSNNQGDWFGQFINVQKQTDAKNRWNAQLQHQEAFHDEGWFLGVGNMHTFNEKYFSEVGVGFGTDASFLSQFRVDAALNRRWLEAGNFVTTGGVSYSNAQFGYSSIGLLLGASYYFNAPWVVQAGVRVDRSSPGSVYGYSGFVAATYGYQKRFYLTARAGYGREAYQILGPGSINNEFNSHNFGLNWRQWLTDEWGYNIGTEYYKNPAYDRRGVILSVFKEF